MQKDKEDILLKLQTVLKAGMERNEVVQDIHITIPLWLYKEYNKGTKKHQQYYIQGWIASLKDEDTTKDQMNKEGKLREIELRLSRVERELNIQ